jgi:pseudaminic acid cytidylyltransferase
MIVFITVKGESKRCPRKNHKLLPYILDKFSKYLDIIIITDDLELKQIAEQYNVEVYIEDKETQKSEFHSIYHYLYSSNKLNEIKEFIYFPVTQPLKSHELIMNVGFSDITDYDFATSYTIVSNRKIFLLNDDNTFMYDSYERKGSLCENVKMVDGSIYKIKTEFLIKAINSYNVNHFFWNKSKIKFIENRDDFYIDIDTPKDLKQFYKITKK